MQVTVLVSVNSGNQVGILLNSVFFEISRSLTGIWESFSHLI